MEGGSDMKDKEDQEEHEGEIDVHVGERWQFTAKQKKSTGAAAQFSSSSNDYSQPY